MFTVLPEAELAEYAVCSAAWPEGGQQQRQQSAQPGSAARIASHCVISLGRGRGHAESGRRRAQDISNAIWGFAKLYHLPPNDLLQAVSLYLLRHWHRFKPQELANVLWSLAVLKACNPDAWCARLGGPVIPLKGFCCHFLNVYICLESEGIL